MAFGITPTGSAWIGTPNAATDGVYDTSQFADQGNGVVWLQLALGQAYVLNQVKLWHYYADSRTYHGVIVQLSNTVDFSSGVTTVFN